MRTSKKEIVRIDRELAQWREVLKVTRGKTERAAIHLKIDQLLDERIKCSSP